MRILISVEDKINNILDYSRLRHCPLEVIWSSTEIRVLIWKVAKSGVVQDVVYFVEQDFPFVLSILNQ